MNDDEELQRIRAARAEQLRAARSQGGYDPEAEARRRHAEAEQQAQIEAVLRQVLTQEARERLQRVRIARPDQAKALEKQIVAMAGSGRLRGQLSDEDLKAILTQLFPPTRDINIRRKGSIE